MENAYQLGPSMPESAAANPLTNSTVPMRSPVNWALLGLVIERPSYGYELVKRFQREYEDVLPLSSESHVYTALKALERRGLIEETPGKGGGRQPKPCYHATATG